MVINLASEMALCEECGMKTAHNTHLEIYPTGEGAGEIFFRRQCSECNHCRTNVNPFAEVKKMFGRIAATIEGKSDERGIVLRIYKDEEWGYFAAEPGFVDLHRSPVAWLSDESVQRMLDRIETASFSFGVEEIIRMDVSADDIR